MLPSRRHQPLQYPFPDPQPEAQVCKPHRVSVSCILRKTRTTNTPGLSPQCIGTRNRGWVVTEHFLHTELAVSVLAADPSKVSGLAPHSNPRFLNADWVLLGTRASMETSACHLQ